MALNPMNQTNLANYIPSIWAKEVQMATERNLVMANLIDRHYQKYAYTGNKVVVPKMANLSATAFVMGTNINIDNTTQGVVNISINKQYYTATAVDDFTVIQDYVGYFEKARGAHAYALSKEIDTSLAVLVPAFNTGNDVGTQGDAITADTVIDAYTKLNVADAPQAGRSWVFDPESIEDIIKADFFVRMDYVPGSVSANGFQGRQILGAPVYMSNNVDATGAYHNAVYWQQEALALVTQLMPKAHIGRIETQLSDVLIMEALWGCVEMRDTFGVQINTRS